MLLVWIRSVDTIGMFTRRPRVTTAFGPGLFVTAERRGCPRAAEHAAQPSGTIATNTCPFFRRHDARIFGDVCERNPCAP